MKLRRLTYLFANASTLALLSGCSGGATDNSGDIDNSGVDGSTPVGKIGAALVQANDCDDLLNRIQTEAITGLHATADTLRDPARHHGGDVLISEGGVATDGMLEQSGVTPSGPAGAPAGDPAAAPAAGLDGAQGADEDSNATGGESKSREHSDTNTQVAGVDEADIVKTDGERLYLVHGTELFVLDVGARNATLVESQTTIEGQPTEMFVEDGVAVVFSYVNPTPELAGSQAALDALYRFSDAGHSKMTVIDLKGSEAKVLREVYTQGSYVSSRRVGDVVRSVIRGPSRYYGYEANIEYYDLFGQPYEQAVIDEQVDAWLARKEAELKQTGLDYWLPVQREKQGNSYVTVARDCTSHYVPAPGLTEPGATTILSLNLSDVDGALGGATILGGAEQIYANAESLYLSHYDTRFHRVRNADSREQTALHHFALDGDQTKYTASGFIPGRILNQFSMDEKDGVLRVATTENKLTQVSDPEFPSELWFNSTPENRVYTVEGEGQGLNVIGQTPALGHEGETIFSVRFIGDLGYVVTFLQTDPLVVLDLSDPKKPTVEGELEIPGFSSYLHPMSDGHLLAIGRDGGMQLQIFDVTDPKNPKQAHKWVAEGYSSAEGQHKAFNYYPKFQMLTFPFIRYGEATASSSLEVFHVDAEGGFQHLASLDHSDMMRHACEEQTSRNWGLEMEGISPEEMAAIEEDIAQSCSYNVGEVKRGVFIDDLLYSISDAGVLAHDVVEFALASKLELPAPNYYYGQYYDGPNMGVDRPAPVMGGMTSAMSGAEPVPDDTPEGSGAATGGSAGATGGSESGDSGGATGSSESGGSGGATGGSDSDSDEQPSQ